MIASGASCFLLLIYILIQTLIPYFSGSLAYAHVSDVSEELVSSGRYGHRAQIVMHYYYYYHNQLFTGRCDPDFSKNRYGIGDSVMIKISPVNPNFAVFVENYEFKVFLLVLGWVTSFMIAFGLYKWG